MTSTYRALVVKERERLFPSNPRAAHYLYLDLYPLLAVKSWIDLRPEDLITYTALAAVVFGPREMPALPDLQLTLMRNVLCQTIPTWLYVDQRDINRCPSQIRDFNVGFDQLMDEYLSIKYSRFNLEVAGEKGLHALITSLCRDLKRVDSDRPITET